MALKQYTLDELEAMRLDWNAGKRRPPYRRRCAYPPCNSLFYSRSKTRRCCTEGCRQRLRQLTPLKVCVCGTVFSPVEHVKFNGKMRTLTQRKKFCSAKCRNRTWCQINRRRTEPVTVPMPTTHPDFVPRYRKAYKPRKRRPAGKMRRPILW